MVTVSIVDVEGGAMTGVEVRVSVCITGAEVHLKLHLRPQLYHK